MATTDSAKPSVPEILYRADPNAHHIHGTKYKRDKNGDKETETAPPTSPYDLTGRGILRNNAILQYILETSVYPREHKALQGLRKATEEKHAWSMMATTGDEGQFLGLLLKLINAKNTIELGVFTGYSLLCTALALPDDGKVIALDINRNSYNIGVPFIEEAGVAHKIDFRKGPALDSLKALLSEEKNHGFFDFVFVDADKDNYMNYHPLLLKLVKLGGIIAYDNTLWSGSVADDNEASIPEFLRYYRKFIRELNTFLAADPRIEISHLSINDGLTLCRRIV